MNNPSLLFDFYSNERLYFTNPEKIYTTSSYDEVESLLDTINEKIKQGYYAAGYVSYEVTYPLLNIKSNLIGAMPLLWFGIFKEPTKFEPFSGTTYTIGNWEKMISKANYLKNIDYILSEIKSGKIEQINYTVPFQATFTGDAYAYYARLKAAQKTKYSAFLDIGNFQILSISPELFFDQKDTTVAVRPMKGTIHRGKTFEEDIALKKWLYESKKNRLENDIITNLMKDELSTIANNVSIENQYEIEKYETVYQMTTSIHGKTKPSLSAIDILKNLFPCGSISGVPKISSIEAIKQLEAIPREVYTGAIGYITPTNNAVFNVPIRTVTIDRNRKMAKYHAGGAITAQSKPNEEYEEMMTKTRVLTRQQRPFQLLETLRLENGSYFLLDDHLTRIENSASYFSFPFSRERILFRLLDEAKKHSQGIWRVRLTLNQSSEITLEVVPLAETKRNVVKLAQKPIDSNHVFLYHKTTNRTIFEEHLDHLTQQELDILLWNENEELTEFTIGNIVVELDGKLYTPPVKSGLLSGTFRMELLRKGEIRERVLFLDDLKKCNNIWLINSVRKWVKVRLNT